MWYFTGKNHQIQEQLQQFGQTEATAAATWPERKRERVVMGDEVREREREGCGWMETEGRGGQIRRIRIRMIYSFRPLPLMKGCRWMTYHLTVHTIIIPMSKKTIKLTTMYLTRY